MQVLVSEENLKNKKRFSFWFVFSLILNGYASGIPGISLGSVVFIVMVIYTLLKGISGRKLFVEKETFRFGGVITFTSLLGFFVLSILEPDLSVPLGSTIVGFAKFWLWVFMTGVVVCDNYDEDSLRIWFCRFALLLTVYLLLQNLAFYAIHIYLPNIFRFGPLQPYAEEYANYDRLASAQILRAGSLLSESSFYGNFVICAIALYLNRYIRELQGKKILFVLFLTIGVILSGSTSAIIIIGIIFFVYYKRVNASTRWQMLFLLALGIVVAAMIWPQMNGSSIGASIQYSFAKFTYLDSSSRFGKSYGYLKMLPQKIFIFGTGIGSDNAIITKIINSTAVYLNSVTSLIIQSGVMGCSMFLIMIGGLFRSAWRQRNLVSCCLLLAYFAKGFASGIYFSTYGVVFMFIVVGQIKKERISKNATE